MFENSIALIEQAIEMVDNKDVQGMLSQVLSEVQGHNCADHITPQAPTTPIRGSAPGASVDGWAGGMTREEILASQIYRDNVGSSPGVPMETAFMNATEWFAFVDERRKKMRERR